MGTALKYTKMKKAHPKRAKVFFFFLSVMQICDVFLAVVVLPAFVSCWREITCFAVVWTVSILDNNFSIVSKLLILI